MIRELRKADIDKVADIWLDTNIRAHDFIPAQYWESNLQRTVPEMPARMQTELPGGCG